MTVHLAQLNIEGIVERVLVFPDGTSTQDATTLLGGDWVATDALRPVGPGARYENGQMWPWGQDLASGSLWCITSAWDAVPLPDRQAFEELTGLTAVQEPEHTVFGGRTITEDDVAALIEVLG